MNCVWLPDLLDYPNWADYEAYEDDLYRLFRSLYITMGVEFQNKKLKLRYEPIENGKIEAFYHLTCKNYNDKSSREPDPDRMVRIEWPKAFLENYICHAVCCFDKPLYWVVPDKRYDRHKILFEDYVLIVEDRKSYFLLVTGFYAEGGYKKNLLKEYAKYC